MDETFPALLARREGNHQVAEITRLTTDDLMPGNVVVSVEHSTVNYKDGLALSGRAPVIKRWPMVPGIDLAGTVEASKHPEFKPGDAVVLNGWGIGEGHFGGFAAKARVDGDWLLHLPAGLSTAQAMAIGTAGYTAMLAILALERHGLRPGEGEILVTGAAGGVGSMSIALLSSLGFRVIAATGRPEEADYLINLGAFDLIDRQELAGTPSPLARQRWAGAVDATGGVTLANVLSHTRYGGAVAACGMADSMDLPASVGPFILRAVTLYGIDSVYVPKKRREEAWERLARTMKVEKLARMTRRIGLEDVPRVASEILEGKVRGRVVVDIGTN